MNFRKAESQELDEIYQMGFDAWADEMTESEYMNACRASTKYKKGQFYVLPNEKGSLVSSLVLYPFTDVSYGLGSLATPPELRQRGYATQLMQVVLSELDRVQIHQVFLYADISPEFYERVGFRALPAHFQTKEFSICMVRTKTFDELMTRRDFLPPRYF